MSSPAPGLATQGPNWIGESSDDRIQVARVGYCQRMPAYTPPRPLVDAFERARVLDAPAQSIAKRVRQLLAQPRLKQAISGTWLGHPVHPPLPDVVIGSFLSASLLDVIAPHSGGTAARRLISVGITATLPTALTGISDWADTELSDERVRRVGLVHAELNSVALLLYTASLRARRRDRRLSGMLLAFAGATVLGFSGYLGGHMSYMRGIGVNQTAFDPGPPQWTAVLDSTELRDGQLHGTVAEDAPVLLVRHNGGLYAIHNRCSHRGCLLSEGELDGAVITCPCHGSQFDVRDGTLVRGPATTGQPQLDVRETNGHIEVRTATRG
ncbi:Rieske 2Fe-2S domain-containing protein [Mycobacterium kansasii]|uniref:Rieske 2Fe-2S domain-containing protein n=1 Tax=Mycobacterium kansasii TaxID=1768 RepID=UPI000C078409|nr:Rieske 2Fe-2S domain-containing protein [Mycobacterium kansasii]